VELGKRSDSMPGEIRCRFNLFIAKPYSQDQNPLDPISHRLIIDRALPCCPIQGQIFELPGFEKEKAIVVDGVFPHRNPDPKTPQVFADLVEIPVLSRTELDKWVRNLKAVGWRDDVGWYGQ
jgi:hypothetical protein